jgi:CubicO group peptidase (beta-lactamase class C family)
MKSAAMTAAVWVLAAGLGNSADEREDRIGALVTSLMERHKVPGVSVAVVQDGRIAWARGWGVKAAGARDPVDADTLFQAASISKPVAAVGALRLVDDQRLALDEDVNARLRSWKLPENELTAAKKVTLRMLLSHTGGLTVHGFRGYMPGEDVPTLPQVLDGAKPANSAAVRVAAAPGTNFKYSGGGYCIVQLLMTDAAGGTFPEILRERVLEPLGMKQSTYEQPLPEARRPAAARGHLADGTRLAKGDWATHPEMAAAGLWTTPSDLARFAIAIQKRDKVLSEALYKELLTPQAGGPTGLGLFLNQSGRFAHNGANLGFRCLLVGCRDTGQAAVVMTNADSGGPVHQEVVGAIAREYGWPK